MPLRLSRREWICLGTSALTMLHSRSSAATAVRGRSLPFVDPITALTVAKTGIDLMNMFAKRGGGLAPMLRYQYQMLGEISAQLTSIQRQLLEIERAIGDLPDKVRKALAIQFRTELMSQIAGSIELFTEEILKPSRRDPTIFENPTIKARIFRIYSDVAQNRATLSKYEEGYGPHACMTAPVTLSLEVVCAAHLDEPAGTIVGKLNSYNNWFEKMLEDRPNSIVGIQKAAVARHDKIIENLKNNRLAQRLKIEEFKVKGQQYGERSPDPCVVTGLGKVSPLDDQNATVTPLLLLDRVGRHSVFLTGELVLEANTLTGALEIRYMRSDKPKVGFNIPTSGDGSYTGDVPRYNDYCYYQRIPEHYGTKVLTEAEAIELVKSSPLWSSDDVNRAQLEASLASLNYERANIAFCAMAGSVVAESKHRIVEYRSILG